MKQMVMLRTNKEFSGSLVEHAQAPIPEISHPFDIRIRVAAAGVCRTDLHIIGGLLPVGLPHVLGHENAGWVDEVGSLVTTVKNGDAVICYPFISDGLSISERKGLDSNAPNRITPGINSPGGYSEFLLANERSVIKVPATADLTELATLTDAGLTAYRACKRASQLLGVGDIAIILGIGGLGHLAVQILDALSVATVVAVDNRPKALAIATACGANTTCLAQDLTSTFSGMATVVLDFVGTNSTSVAALECLAFGGTYIIIGTEGSISTTMLSLIKGERRIEGVYAGTYSELHDVTQMALAGLVRPHVQKYHLEDANQALHDLLDGKINGRGILVP